MMFRKIFFVVCLIGRTIASPDSTSNNIVIDPQSIQLTCQQIAQAAPGIVSYPTDQIYQFEESRYWSNFQAFQTPTCRITPISSVQVSLALKIIVSNKTKFAVKSGGHAAMAGASNTDEGVVIDLSGLNSINVSKDKSTVTYGTGLRWVQIYQVLDPLGISILGGRVADIGVGGLTLGGGLSFFSSRYGWVCDGVINFEVVLSNGKIVNANHEENSDLWWALKGGGNNFGIVTQMTVKAFPQGLMWAGSRIFFADAQKDNLINGFVDVSNKITDDPYAHIILAFTEAPVYGRLAALDFDYGLPIEYPAIYDDFKPLVPLIDTMDIKSLSELTIEFNQSNPGGFRQMYGTATFTMSASLVSQFVSIFYSQIDPIFASVEGFVPAIVLQPLSVPLLSVAHKTRGNPLGVSDRHGPLLLMSLSLQWANAADDDAVMSAGRSVIAACIAYSKTVNMDNRFIYQNYAILGQDVFDSYGRRNKERLQLIANKYDKRGVFQVLQPGYFKLF